MPRRTTAILLMLLLVAPAILVAAPLATARAQGETEQKFSGITPADSFNYTAISVSSASIVGYATETSLSVETAFMTGAQLQLFSQTGDITNSVYYQTGTESYDALLEVPGTYYLVVYNPNGEATDLSALYIVNPDINLRNSTTSVGETIEMTPGELLTLPLHVETLGSPCQLQILGASSQIVTYGLEDNTTGQLVFESPDVTVTNFTVYPTVSVGYNFSLSPGFYIMGIDNVSPNPAIVYFSYNIVPEFVNPYILHFGSPSPTGIAAYGIYNNSGTISTYKVATDAVVGFADVSQLSATDHGTNSSLASLQENNILEVNNTDGSTFTYWPQNVLAFDTASPSTVTYRDNVLNVTGDNAQLTNQSITGVGTTSGYDNNGVQQTYYGNYNSNYTYTYTLPQTWVLYMNETVQTGRGVLIQMGVRAVDGGTPDKVTWFDSIMINDPSVASADFVVNGRAYTPAGVESPIGTYFDSELVFGGGAGGNAAEFQVKANLALFYQGQTLQPYPAVYSFGDDTAEAAYNIDVTYGNGVATATGTSETPYYGILTNDFNASLTALVSQALAKPSSSGIPGIGYIVAGAVVAVVVILALVVVVRRRAKPAMVEAPAIPAMQPATAFCGNCGTPIDPAEQFCHNCGAPQHHGDGTQQPGPPPPPGY